MPDLCTTCGNVLPANAPRGFCPTCLLRGGITLGEDETLAMPGRLADATTSPEPILGGRYKLGEKLGEGGFGIVYEAEQIEPLQRIVAVKVLKLGMAAKQVIARFDAERQTLALLQHEHIARVLDAGATGDGRPFFVMERVRGLPVTAFVKQHQMPLQARLALFARICDAVHYAHQKGVIHRDLKPSNVLVEDHNGSATPKIIDFGVAKAIEGPLTDHTIFTGVDQLLGTPGYMSPEQIEHGNAAIDTRADVYALGAILYELLCDAPLIDPSSFAGKPVSQLLKELASRKAAAPSLHTPALRGDLDAITLKALAPDPTLRYSSADALAEDVRRFLQHQPIIARAPSHAYLLGKFVRRHRMGVAASAAVVVAMLGGGISSTLLYLDAEKSNREKVHSIESLEMERDRVIGQRRENQRSQSRYEFSEACRLSEAGRRSDAVAKLCRACRIDPANDAAATYLVSMLGHVHISRQVTPAHRAPAGYDRMTFVGAMPGAGQALAVCTAKTKQKDGKSVPDMLCRWDLATNRRSDTPLADGVTVRCLTVSLDEQRVFLGLSSGDLLICELASSSFTTIPNLLASSLSALAISPNGTQLLAGADDGGIRLVDLNAMKPSGTALQLRGAVKKLVFGEIATLAAAWAGDAVVMISPTEMKPVGLPLIATGIDSFALQPRGERIALGLASGSAQLREAPNGSYVGWPIAHGASVTATAFGANGRALVTGDAAGLLLVHDARNGALLAGGNRMDGSIVYAESTGLGGHVMTVSGMGELRLWNPLSGDVINRHRLRKAVSTAAVSRSGTHLAVALRDERAMLVWEMHGRMTVPRYIAANHERPSFAEHLHRAPPDDVKCAAHAWNSSGTHVALLDNDGRITINPGELSGIRSGNVVALALSNDALTLVTGHRDGNIRVWRTSTGEPSPWRLHHDDAVRGVAIHPDGSVIATVTTGGEFRFWDAISGEPMTPKIDHGDDDGVSMITFSSDGRNLCFQRENGGWFAMPVPQRHPQVPEWFLNVAEAVARRHLNDDGSLDTLGTDALAKAIQKAPVYPTPDEEALVRFARWLGTDLSRRTLWSESTESFDDYVHDLESRDDVAALRELLKIDPTNATALSKLRSHK